MIDRHMGSRTWVSAQGFSMADCAAAPALFFTSSIEPFPDELRSLQAYFNRLIERPSFRRVIEEAKPYFPLYPFASSLKGLSAS
jgi:glutathione S-transferase